MSPMNPRSEEHEADELERKIVFELREHDEPLDSDELVAEIGADISEAEFRLAISELLDEHRIVLTPEWEYKITE